LEKTPGSGRKAGTPNKSTVALIEKCEELKVDPFEFLCLVMKGDWKALGMSEKVIPAKYDGETMVEAEKRITPEIKFEDRLFAAKEVASYLYPKRKAVALSAEDEQGIKVIIEDWTKK
jgi:hypothetical protein